MFLRWDQEAKLFKHDYATALIQRLIIVYAILRIQFKIFKTVYKFLEKKPCDHALRM